MEIEGEGGGGGEGLMKQLMNTQNASLVPMVLFK